ncbi:MAG: hypothetical protein HQM02_06095, partial [Magnetococcales bacterium]|nr:hypothetical protein [Magnetococcales bacterium]
MTDDLITEPAPKPPSKKWWVLPAAIASLLFLAGVGVGMLWHDRAPATPEQGRTAPPAETLEQSAATPVAASGADTGQPAPVPPPQESPAPAVI